MGEGRDETVLASEPRARWSWPDAQPSCGCRDDAPDHPAMHRITPRSRRVPPDLPPPLQHLRHGASARTPRRTSNSVPA